jgi:AcrR family transcriptional regulator
MEEQHQDILVRSTAVFMRYGMKSVTMDDVARELKVSKKTLYKYVSDKEDLIVQALELYLNGERCRIQETHNKAGNAIEEMVIIIRGVTETLRNIHPSIHYDMEKYYPRAWKLMKDHKEHTIYGTILENLKRGIEEGYYRENLNPEIIARFYSSTADMVFDGSLFPADRYTFTDVYLEYVRYHIRGIASKKGNKYLTEMMQNGQTLL